MLFLWREGKWDEVVYADMFFTLRNHPEWQKDCGINLAPQDPVVLAIEKERNKQNEILKRCCSACSIGQRCLKVGSQNERLEDVDAVFSESEKQMVVRAARAQVQALVLAGTLPGTVDNHVPITNPSWDPNQTGTRNLLVRYREWIVYGIRNAVPKSKVQGADARDLERLLETAWQVYRNRDSRKEKQMGKTIANATVAALRTIEGQTPPWSNSNEGRGVMRSGASAPLRGNRGNQPLLKDQCVYCKQLGHWKKDYPRLGKS
ncbi:hypothetical protein QYF61_007371, partial [Mycteria americana]